MQVKSEEIDEHILKLRGTANLPGEIDKDKNHIIAAEFSITDIAFKSLENNKWAAIYTAEPQAVMQLKENGEKVKLPTGSRSMKQRRALLHYFKEHNIEGDFAMFYDKAEASINANIPEIIKLLGI